MGNSEIDKRAIVVAQMRRIMIDVQDKLVTWADWDYIQQCLDAVECTLELCCDRNDDPDAHTPLQGMEPSDGSTGVLWLLDFMARVAHNNQ